MTKMQLLISAALLAAATQVPASAPGLAQTAKPSASAQTGAAAGAQAKPEVTNAPAVAGQEGPDEQNQEADASNRFAVQMVTGIEVIQTSHKPTLDVVRITGLVASSGWTNPVIVPLGSGNPSDGMLDLILMADSPGETQAADGFVEVEAILPIEPGHPYKGIRARSSTNALTLHKIPGSVELPAPAEDCSKCVGKAFIAKGQALPAGVGADQAVKEEALPPQALVIKPTDGIGHIHFDPNRLIVIIGEDGRIVDAFWN